MLGIAMDLALAASSRGPGGWSEEKAGNDHLAEPRQRGGRKCPTSDSTGANSPWSTRVYIAGLHGQRLKSKFHPHAPAPPLPQEFQQPPKMKAAVMLAAAAFVRLSLAAPAHAVFKRGEIFNLYQLAVNSFSDQTTKDLFRKNLELLWRPAGPLPISTAYFSQMASEYAARMQSYLDKGLDEQVADALTRLYHSHNSKEYPVEKAYVDDFINKIAATMEGK